ncbi:MAG: hypothetical protein ACU0BJ_12370 [Shimia sp.]|uniref:hypothetical protein n=1 Tax=Shimia sp. TaxID=1954381 RepID=UPI00405886AE
MSDVGLSVNPADIIDRLDLGFMGYFEGYNANGWGFNVDYGFMDLSDNGTFAGGLGTADADIFQGILTATLFLRVVDTPDTLVDVYGGIPWWDTDIDVAATLGAISADVSMGDNWVDPHIGIRFEKQLPNSDWALNLQGDIGGFGIASDFAWTAVVGVTWYANEKFALEIGYRAQGVDFESGVVGTPSHFSYDTVTHGPRIGAVFKF